MAFIDLGKLKFNWQGVWNAGTAYETDDVVFHDNQTWVATADIATGQNEPQANASWDLMNGGLNFRGVYSGATTYYLHDMVTYGSALYLLNGTDNQTGVDPGSNPGSDNWDILTPAPDANVLHAVGDMVYRNKDNGTARLVVTQQAGKGLNTVEAPLETYSARAFTYEEVSGYGNTFTTAGSIPAVSYTITTNVQRGATTYENWIVSGSDRNGTFTNVQDGDIYVNIGDTIVFDNSGISGHPMQIVTSSGGAAVTTGTYTGGGTATVTWVTTGVAAGTYYYQCQTAGHGGMIGQIIVQDTTNRQGTSTGHGSIDVCRGKEYTITIDNVTNTGVAYDLFVDTGTAGTSKQLTAAEGSSGQVTYNGSAVTLTFTPNETTPNTVYIRNSSGTAVNPAYVEITVNDLKYVPSWGKATASGSLGGGTDRAYKLWNCNYNTATNSLLENDHAGGDHYGRGLMQPGVHTHRMGGYIDGTNTMRGFGDAYHNGTQGYTYYSNAIGYPLNYQHNHPPAYKGAIMYPEFLYAAFAGDTNYEHWLLDVDGNNTNWTCPTDIPVREIHRTRTNSFMLLENGLVFVAGYDGYGISGNGAQYSFWNFVNQSYYDINGTKLEDATFPRIRQISLSTCGDLGPGYNDAHYGALDVDGNLYVGGHNNYGQLGRGGTTNQVSMLPIDPSLFNNEKVVYFQFCGNSYSSSHAITETGRLYSWGYNNSGLLGVGGANYYQTPQYAQGVSGTSIAGKTVVHVIQQGNESTVGATYCLCSDGTVHSAGYAEYHGCNLGYAMANNGWQTVYRQIGSTSDIYADNQKVVSLWAKGSRYAGLFLITDGGDNGRPSVWSFGSNNQGQNATNQGTSDNTSTSSLGHFGLYECQVQLPSNYHENTATIHAYSSDAVHNVLNVGAPVAVFCNGYHNHESMTCVMVTSTGMALWCGRHDSMYLTSNRGPSYEYNQMTHNGDYAIAWTVVPHMPKIKEVIHSSYGEANENGTIFLAQNGDIHLFGGHSWGANMNQFGPTTTVLN